MQLLLSSLSLGSRTMAIDPRVVFSRDLAFVDTLHHLMCCHSGVHSSLLHLESFFGLVRGGWRARLSGAGCRAGDMGLTRGACVDAGRGVPGEGSPARSRGDGSELSFYPRIQCPHRHGVRGELVHWIVGRRAPRCPRDGDWCGHPACPRLCDLRGRIGRVYVHALVDILVVVLVVLLPPSTACAACWLRCCSINAWRLERGIVSASPVRSGCWCCGKRERSEND